MLPSDPHLHMGEMRGFNNKLLISTAAIRLRLNKDVNDVHTEMQAAYNISKPKHQEHKQHHEVRQHEDKELALITLGLLGILGVYYFL